MKMTTPGFPASVCDETDRPETVSGSVNAGSGVPSGNMEDEAATVTS